MGRFRRGRREIRREKVEVDWKSRYLRSRAELRDRKEKQMKYCNRIGKRKVRKRETDNSH